MAFTIGCQFAGQAVPQVTAAAFVLVEGDGVGFVDDDQFGGGPHELVAPATGLDVVGGDHHEGIKVEKGLANGRVPLQPGDCGRKDQLCLDVELLGQLFLPLLGQVGRAKHGQAPHFTPVQELAGDQAGLNRLANAHVVGNQKAHRIELECHE